MRYTSAEANKLLKKLEGKISDLKRKEEISASFLVASGEDTESLRPEYDFDAVQQQLDELEAKVRKVKHAINGFNLTHQLPGFDGLTVDQALVLIPQMSERITKLRKMSEVLPKQRVDDHFAMKFIDYRVSNYDIAKAEEAYNEAKNTLSKLHLALDSVNMSETMEIDIEE